MERKRVGRVRRGKGSKTRMRKIEEDESPKGRKGIEKGVEGKGIGGRGSL